MNRSTLIARWFALVAFLALLSAVTWLALAPADADAQEATPTSATLTVTPLSADDDLRTVSVDFVPADSGIGALQGHFDYDPDKVSIVSCAVSEAGSCNDVGGQVKFVAFNLRGIQANDQLMTVDFVSNGDATGTTSFELVVELVGDRNANQIDGFDVEPLEIALASVEQGSLTGEVLEPETAVGLFGLDVCAVNTETEATTCTTTSGRGTWRLDDLAAGNYEVSISDAGGAYETATFDAFVTDGEVTGGLTTVMEAVTTEQVDPAADTDGETSQDTTDEPADTTPTERDEITADTSGDTEDKIDAIEVSYGASIEGVIQDITTATPLPGIKVCATQPKVRHRSCALTNESGDFTIEGLSAGNFWITAVDPLGTYEIPPQKLVGLNADDAVRTGIVVQMAPR